MSFVRTVELAISGDSRPRSGHVRAAGTRQLHDKHRDFTMPKPARRLVFRIVGTPCLATAIALPAISPAAPAAVAQGPNTVPAASSPPAPQSPGTPGPGPGTSAPPATSGPPPNSAPPATSTPEQPGAPTYKQPQLPESKPGAGTPEQPGAPASSDAAKSPGPQQFGPNTQRETEDRIAALGVPEAEKQKLRDGLAKAIAAINDSATKPADKAAFEKAVDGINVALKLSQAQGATPAEKAMYEKVASTLASAVQDAQDSKTTPSDRDEQLRVVSIVGDTLKVIADRVTPPQDRATYSTIVHAISEAMAISLDPGTTSQNKSVHRFLMISLATNLSALQEPRTDTVDRAILIKFAESLAAGFLAGLNPQTAPKNAQDREAITKALEKIAGEARQASATLQDPQASPEERTAAQQKLVALTSALPAAQSGAPPNAPPGAPQNSKYPEFLTEVKKYDPPAACLDVIDRRTAQVGWPDGSLWGLSDDACAATLLKAGRENTGTWKALFTCVRDQPFSTCLTYIPKD
ncbi:hypothetical protein ACFRCG_29150 [Embleya sp. NPDC056575]|uniref:hypothetical protein n=1 Tax=unclassified Embleya TaxID=2699296 RepID=UPI0036978F47